jgi:uncharacterized protein
MSAQPLTRTVVDSLDFARTEGTLRGSLPIAGLTRLHESLHDTLGRLEYVVRGGADARRRPTLMLEIRGTLHLRCQRCLGVLDHTLRIANTLVLVSPAEAESAQADEDEFEWIAASPALDVAVLIEDEVILSLPYAPRHEEGRCGWADAAREPVRSAAFARLAALRKDDH